MRTSYSRHEEQAVRVERLVREWTRSGLLEKAQEERILPELKVDLRRTNLFFRAMLFAFGVVIILSAVLLVGITLSLNDEVPAAILCLAGAVGSFALSNLLVRRIRLYRFGIEEAAAIAGGTLLALAAGIFAASPQAPRSAEFPALIGLLSGVIAGFAIYIRYHYVYAAIAGMLCMILSPFQTPMSETAQHVAAGALCLVVFAVFFRLKRNQTSFDYPADDYSIIKAVAWIGIYVSLNLQVSSFGSLFRSSIAIPMGPFYWLTYIAIWLIPVSGLYLALRARERPLLDVSIGLTLLTLATNKAYLGIARQTWDPIILGIFLIAAAVILKRRLSSGNRDGFTAERILLADERGLSALGTASAAMPGAPPMPADHVPVRHLDPGGGRSGGAGASGSF